MKLKYYKYHIIVLIFLILLYALFAFFFQYSVSKSSEIQAISISEDVANQNNEQFKTKIDNYKSLFEINQTISDVKVINKKDNIDFKFNNVSYIIDLESDIEKDSNSSNYNVYIKTTDGIIGKIEFNSLFLNQNNNEKTIIFLNDGTILYNGLNNKTKFYDLIRSQNNNEKTDEIKESLQKNDLYKSKLVIENEKYFVITQQQGDYAFANFILVSSITTKGYSISGLSLAYSFAVFVLIILAVIVFYFIVKKESANLIYNNNRFRKDGTLILKIDKKGNVLSTNKVFSFLIGTKNIFRNINQLKGIDTLDLLESCRLENSFIASYETTKETIYTSFQPVTNKNDYYLVGKNVTQKYLSEKFLLDLSSKNPITNSPNLMSFAAKFDMVKESAEDKNVSIISFTICDFHEIKKVLGRMNSDYVLKEFIKLLNSTFTKADVYHHEEFEFVVVSYSLFNKTANEIAKVFEEVKEPLIVNDNHIFVKLKAGVFKLEMPLYKNIDFNEAVTKLEIASTKAKTTINKDIIVYDQMVEAAYQTANKMQADIISGIQNNEFQMYYQPQYDVNSEKIVGFEALIRWNNPKYSHISPQVFIEKAEQSGSIIQIGNFVIKEVFKAAKEFEKHGIHLSCNVSPAQIVQAGFTSDLLAEYESNNLKPGSVAIEITETFLMENFTTVIEKLKILKNNGFSIHLDDFGTGYSSMLYLKDLPIDTIKVDKEFIRHVEVDKFSRTIVKKIISLAVELELDIICEGVENMAQSNLVKKMGCDVIQGYLIGKAMPYDDAIKLVLSGPKLGKK